MAALINSSVFVEQRVWEYTSLLVCVFGLQGLPMGSDTDDRLYFAPWLCCHDDVGGACQNNRGLWARLSIPLATPLATSDAAE